MKYYLQNHNNNYVDPFFDDFFNFPFGGEVNHNNNIMKTDVYEEEDHYEVKVEVPEIKKEDIKLELNNGYLTISATLNNDNKVKEHHKVVRRERFSGTYQRSFYVGDTVKEEDIKAKLENGVLTLMIQKKVEPKEENKKLIQIE